MKVTSEREGASRRDAAFQTLENSEEKFNSHNAPQGLASGGDTLARIALKSCFIEG
jgi:hypothetical protein